ncbi:UDP-N-acetylmuramoyl-tripeptide--D-alanyl-D-alanine ligase [Bacillus sp. CGMCC 1.16607]|uniref:UDP-N-acetylmuramoyl-tripeptide--D-alanyl-D- alanine ligase n=1 Tax=Bacillus sp. CGMCC 1.16607 TaxID=3351842 RepID=UPI003637D6C2
MKNLMLNEIITQIGGDFHHGSGNPTIKHVLDYSKKEIEDHTLVFHMDGERIRGKHWKENHSIVIVTDQPNLCTDLGKNIILIQTTELEKAYWKFIEYYRSLFSIPVIGVSGTCGKTTTKEMIRQILNEDFKVKATWMSMNSMSVNLRYLTGIDEKTEVAVFEMPVAYPGYLRIACRCFQPQIRILLNIGVHHLADCETPEVYMKAKGEIVEGMDPVNGNLILNADDENIRKIIDPSPYQNIIYFGKNKTAQFRAKNIQYAKDGMTFTLIYGEKDYEAFIPGYGEHNIYNALAAIAAVTLVGIDIQTAIKRLATFEQVKEHLEMKDGTNGCTVIDDSWNSSPLSMATGLQVLKDVSRGKKSIALLGYMPQLGEGPYAEEQYAEMGKKAFETKIDLLIIVGEKAKEIGIAALRLGMNANKVHFCETGDEVFDILQPHLNEDSLIFLKVTHRVMKRPSFQELKRKLIPEDV